MPSVFIKNLSAATRHAIKMRPCRQSQHGNGNPPDFGQYCPQSAQGKIRLDALRHRSGIRRHGLG